MHMPASSPVAQAPGSDCPRLDATADVQLGLVRRLLDDDRAYAGLAHLAALEPAVRASAQAVHLQAELLRRTGAVQEAQQRYQELLQGCLAGRGHHGLGLLAARADTQRALTELREAARLLPTDARVRNDLGYALLLSRDTAGARREFLTAVELGDPQGRAESNLLLLTLYEGDMAAAERLRRRLQLSPADWERMQRQAREMQAGRLADTDEEG